MHKIIIYLIFDFYTETAMRELRCLSVIERNSSELEKPKKAKQSALLAIFKHCQTLEGELVRIIPFFEENKIQSTIY